MFSHFKTKMGPKNNLKTAILMQITIFIIQVFFFFFFFLLSRKRHEEKVSGFFTTELKKIAIHTL